MSQERITLIGNISLSKLVHVRMKKKNKAGELIDCLVIPIENNSLQINEFEGKEGKVVEVVMPVRVLYNPERDPKTKQNGFIAKSLPTEIYKEKKDDEAFLKEQQPILGNIRSFDEYTPTPQVNNAGEKEEYTEEDDLPF